MFEQFAQSYALQPAPSTVIPVGVSIKGAKEKYHLDEVYKLASNENPYGVSPKALEAMTAALRQGHLYPDSTRDTLLRGMLAEKFGMKPGNITLTCGAANALAYAGEAFLKPGTECIIPSPAYPPYYYIAFKNGAKIVDVPCRPDTMQIDTEAILAAVTAQTRMVFLCNPQNPTSTAITGDQMRSLLDRLPKHVIAVVDEAYIEFSENAADRTMTPYLEKYPNMIVVQTYSKLYGMAGVRLGYAMACEEIIRYLNKAVAARSLSTVAIEGGIAALSDEDFRKKTIDNNTAERTYLTQTLRSLGYHVFDSQANFIYADLGKPAGELYFDLLPYGVMIRGDFPLARISIGTHQQNACLIDAVQSLREKGQLK